MKKRLPTILLSIVFLVGLALLLYPTVSDYSYNLHATKAISNYSAQVSNMTNDEYDRMLGEAVSYNERLSESGITLKLSTGDMEEYYNLLGDESSVISYIEIPSINVTLPIYHGTDESVLNSGVGHIAGTSLPVGGEGSHCVLSGHRGLPSAKLFTDLDKLVEGDIFTLTTLDETYTYEVDQIRIVDPDDVSDIKITPGEDYCTLVTCTPYGINTHRLLVRGSRIDNLKVSEKLRVTSEAMQIEPAIVAPFAAIPILLIMLIWVFRPGRKKKRDERKDDSVK